VPAYLIAGFITFTRLDMNVHHLSDLAFGAALGSAFGFGTALFHKHLPKKVRVAPMAGAAWGLSASMAF
jgi:membrane-associated phospholipid phosphatase